MITIRQERPADVAAREALLDGPSARPVRQDLGSGCAKAACRPTDCAFVAADGGRIVGTVRLWNVDAGAGRPALLLGPLAVAADCRNRGIGAALMRARRARPRAAAVTAPSAGRRRALLRPLRLLGREDRRPADARAVRAPPAAWPRARPGALDGARGLIARDRPSA